MIATIKKSKTTITFYIIITFIGLISGYKFYTYQDINTKQSITEKIDIKENLSYKSNNILKDLKDIIIIFIYSLLIITSLINLSILLLALL